MTTFKMPEPDGFDSQMRQETYYKDTLVEALRDVLEQAAQKAELCGGGDYSAEGIAEDIRAMIKEIPE